MSHPTRVRGLKQRAQKVERRHGKVAPYTGAWIETLNGMYITRTAEVAPYTGAWIETKNCSRTRPMRPVAPYTGAWIET